MGMDKNHSTFLAEHIPRPSPGCVVHIFKGVTVREIFAQKPSVKNHVWSGEFSADGCYVATSEKGLIGKQ